MRIAFRRMLTSLLFVAAASVQAQANDDWANRTQILALPFHVVTSMGGATNAASDPLPNCRNTNSTTYGTIWFGYTTGAQPEILTLSIANFEVATVAAIYTGSPGTFHLAPGACSRPGGSPFNAQLAGVRLAANTSYSILLSAQTPLTGGVDFTVKAATLYNVTKVADTFDGTCDSDCSLREAIQAANLAAGAVIVPAGTYLLSRTGDLENDNVTGDLDIHNDMGIYGDGMGQTIIDGNGSDRVFDMVSSAQHGYTLILGDLTVTHGSAHEMASPRGGAILSQTLTPGFLGLERVAVVDNHALETGGGVYTESPGTIRDSRFTLNTVDVNVGGGGGGIELLNPNDRPFVIESSTFNGNDGGKTGGGIQSQGNLQLTNSTVSGNNVEQIGGGIYIVNGPFQMSSTTVAFNNAGNPGNNSGGGLLLTSSYNYELFNNIIAGNTDGDCLLFTFTSGVIESHHNHVQDPRECTFTGTGDVVGTDPLLGPLADNGGPTLTHALGYKSPARDVGDPAGCMPLANDQRGAGFPRVDGPACDKGSYEQQVLFADGFEH